VSEAELSQIGEVAERVGLSLRTVRYYEEVGLFEPTGRTQGGFRLYSENDVKRLLVLKGMKPLGLSLEEIRELMGLLDRTADVDGMPADDIGTIMSGLEDYLRLADERVVKLEQHLSEAKKLRARIGDRIKRLKPRADSRARVRS
jgi:DNA-binding transcriptional MerR regulator